MWRIGLLSKLQSYRISNRFINLYSMYSKTKSGVQLQIGLTQAFPTTIGLKQGCNLSQFFLNLFININNIFDEISWQPAHLSDILVNCLLYADDLILVSESRFDLQNCLKLQTYCNKYKLKVNTKKPKQWRLRKDNLANLRKIF